MMNGNDFMRFESKEIWERGLRKGKKLKGEGLRKLFPNFDDDDDDCRLCDVGEWMSERERMNE